MIPLICCLHRQLIMFWNMLYIMWLRKGGGHTNMFSVKKQWAFCLILSMFCLSQFRVGCSMCFLPRTRMFRPCCSSSDTTASNCRDNSHSQWPFTVSMLEINEVIHKFLMNERPQLIHHLLYIMICDLRLFLEEFPLALQMNLGPLAGQLWENYSCSHCFSLL